MTSARRQLIDANATPFYHVINRYVRRAFLCGEDKLTGRSYEHRRGWIVDKIIEIVLTQGLNRQIRRMASALRYKVIDLQRVELMTLRLAIEAEDSCTEAALAEGEMRPLTLDEIATLKAALAII